MFGLFREKTIINDLCIENVASAIVDVWTDDLTLSFEKFNRMSPFSSIISSDDLAESRFLIKKLELITSVSHTLLSKEDAVDLLQQISDKAISMIEGILDQKVSLKGPELVQRAERLAKIRFSTSPKDAGRMIENDFSNFIFKFQPDNSDVDPQYLLYKQLSGLERTAIFKIGSAIRQSQK